jgi:tight adherence protein B
MTAPMTAPMAAVASTPLLADRGMVLAVLGAACAGSAVLLFFRPSAWPVLDLAARGRSTAVRGSLLVLLVVVALATGGMGGGFPLRLAGPGVVLAGAGGGAVALRRAGRRRAARVEEAARVLEACEEVAGELSAGVAPGLALERAAARWPALGPVASAQRFGGSVPGALRSVASRPGAADLTLVAAAWQLSERSGAGLAEALASVAEGLRQQQRTRRVVAAELASARATARLIAGLPILTLATGSGIGSPVSFLLGTGPGLLCLAGGLALAFVGLGWIERIASTLEREA